MTLLTVALLLLGAALFVPVWTLVLWVWGELWHRRLLLPEDFDERHEVSTDDGATVLVFRLRATAARSGLPPVVLCHGLAMNRRALAFTDPRSLGHVLRDRGRDVWVVELRGASGSWGERGLFASGFDHYARHDVPAVLAFVRAQTGADEVDWVGFSMGGMLAYAHLGALGGKGVRRLVTIGSPARFDVFDDAPAAWITLRVGFILHLLRRTPFRVVLGGLAPLLHPALPPALTPGFRGEHYDSRSLRALFASCFGDAPKGVTLQFLRWMRDRRWDSNDGSVDYHAGLARLSVPLMVVLGSADRLCPPLAAREAYQASGSLERRLLERGSAEGCARDYDHLDLILGGDAAKDIFGEVGTWLER